MKSGRRERLEKAVMATPRPALVTDYVRAAMVIHLNELERRVIGLRFGFETGQERRDMQSVADALGISTTRACIALASAQRKLWKSGAIQRARSIALEHRTGR